MSDHLTKAKNALEHAKREEDPKVRTRLIDIAHVQATVALADIMQGMLEHLDLHLQAQARRREMTDAS
jgi:hypothetical protein